MTESTKKIIAKSKATYRNITIYEFGAAKLGVVLNGKLFDDFTSLSEVKSFIDSYYALQKYKWN